MLWKQTLNGLVFLWKSITCEINFHPNRTRLKLTLIWQFRLSWATDFFRMISSSASDFRFCGCRVTSEEGHKHDDRKTGSRMQRRKSLWRSLLPTTDETVRSVSILTWFCLDESLRYLNFNQQTWWICSIRVLQIIVIWTQFQDVFLASFWMHVCMCHCLCVRGVYVSVWVCVCMDVP